MIKQCKNQNEISDIVKYIGPKYRNTPYLYANIVKYGTGNQNIKVWIDYSDDNKISGIYLLYYDCLHFFTNEVDTYPIDTILQVMSDVEHKVFMTIGKVGERIEKIISFSYKTEKNIIMDMDKVGIEERNYKGEIALKDDIEEIVELLFLTEEYTEVYSKKILLEQLVDRFENRYSRFFIIKKDDKIVASCSTYGEVQGFAIVGGVIVHPEYRNRGLAFEVDNYACHILEEENFSRISFVNRENTASLALHEKLGAKPISALYKFIKNQIL